MNATFSGKIREMIVQAWKDQNPTAKITPADASAAQNAAVSAAARVTENRLAMGITWQEAWSEMSSEVLAMKQPSLEAHLTIGS